MSTVDQGKAAEEIAAQYLQKQGYSILERNYYIKGGEIDIIAQREDVIVFVEVRMRKQSFFGLPEETVDEKKQRRIIKAAETYLVEKQITDRYCRFDVLGVTKKSDESYDIRHYQDAFSA